MRTLGRSERPSKRLAEARKASEQEQAKGGWGPGGSRKTVLTWFPALLLGQITGRLENVLLPWT